MHGQLVDIPHGIRAYSLELGPKHGAREGPVASAVLDEELGHSHNIRSLLDLINEDEGVTDFNALAGEQHHPADKVGRILRRGKSILGTNILHEVDLYERRVAPLCEFANGEALANLAGARDEESLATREVLPPLSKRPFNSSAQHMASFLRKR